MFSFNKNIQSEKEKTSSNKSLFAFNTGKTGRGEAPSNVGGGS